MSHSIRLLLNIKDKRVKFSKNYLFKKTIKGTQCLIFRGTLSPKTPDLCPKCGCINHQFDIIKHGFKLIRIKLPRVSNQRTFLELKKQRYLCKHCDHTFTISTSIVKDNHSISNNTFHSCILSCKDKISIKDIAKNHDISHDRLNTWIGSLSSQFIVNRKTLPKHLCFDEFKSVKSVNASMSFIFMDARTHKVIDILQDRRLSYLKSYFWTYPDEVRAKVETICIDMYVPYIECIQACFPNAKIITDRFHVIQHLSRALSGTRIQTMKKYPKHYRKLKRYWKLLLMNERKLDFKNHKHYTCFPYLMTQSQVVDELLRIDSELETSYHIYQSLINAYNDGRAEDMFNLVHSNPKGLSLQMKKALDTLTKHETSIRNSMRYQTTNGPLEGTNNLIKVIKRVAFGYRDFNNFRSRILLTTNTMVRLVQ